MKIRALLAMLLALSPAFARAADSCIVRGKLLGCDGKPMRSAFVRPIGGPDRLVAAGADGSFSITFPRPGGYHVWLLGVHHQTTVVPLLLERPGVHEVEARLAAVRVRDHLDSMRVVGDFNGFSEEGAVFMHQRTNGTFTATVDCKSDTLHYQLLGVQEGGGPLCGTQADAYQFDYRDRTLYTNHGGKFVSAVRARGRPVELVFDPGRLPRSGSSPVVRFADPGSDAMWIAAATQAEDQMQKRYTDAFFAYRASGADPDSFDYDYSADLRTIRAGIAAEPRPLRKQFLKLEYFHIARAESDSTLAQTVLNEVPADSPLWSLEWGGPNNTFSSLARLAHRPADARAYVDRAIESHPDSTVRAAFLFQGLQYARSDRDTNKLRHYYERLEGEYRETQYAARAEKAFDPDRVIQVGKPVPDVAFQGLEDKTKTYRPADFHGRYLLIDFWAVWCGPCVAEMPALHAVWEKYKNRKFAILSVSLDVKRENVAKFRSGKWKMPWLHAYLAGRSQDPVAAAFEVESIPSPVLVDPSGTIVAAGDELRGAGLDATLTRLLGGSPAPPRKD